MKKKLLMILIPIIAISQSSHADSDWWSKRWEGVEYINGMTVLNTDKANREHWAIIEYPKDTCIDGRPVPAHIEIGTRYSDMYFEPLKFVIHIDKNGNLQPEAVQVARGNSDEYPNKGWWDYGGPDKMPLDMIKYKGKMYPVSTLGHITTIHEQEQMYGKEFFYEFTLNKCVRELVDIRYPAWNRFGRFIVPEENPYLMSIEGWLFSKSGKTLINAENFYDEKRERGKTNFILRLLNGELSEEWENIDTIGEQAFLYAEQGSFKKTGKRASIYIDLPKHVKVIGEEAFFGSNLLRDSLTIPETVRYVGDWAFDTTDTFRVVRFMGTTPPKFGEYEDESGHKFIAEIFNWNASTTFIVPDGCKNAYKEAIPVEGINLVEESEYATSVISVQNPTIKIRRNANMLTLRGCKQGEQIQIYSTDGKMISNGTSSGNHDMLFFLPWEQKNVIVRVGNRQIFKIQ